MTLRILAAADWVAVASLVVALAALVASVLVPLSIATRISRGVETSVRTEQRTEVALQALLTELYGSGIPALRHLEKSAADGNADALAGDLDVALRAHARLVPRAALVPDIDTRSRSQPGVGQRQSAE